MQDAVAVLLGISLNESLHFGIAGGITAGLGVLVLTLTAMGTGQGMASVEFFSFYPGYPLAITDFRRRRTKTITASIGERL